MFEPRLRAGRRRLLRRLGGGTLVAGAPALLSACSDAPLATPAFGSIDGATHTLQALKSAPVRMAGAWDLAQVLHHAAQSIEYSMQGFPQPKAAWFRASVGPLAFAVFSARGAMSHDLAEPIPGAPAVAAGQPLEAAVDRVVAALQAFAAHAGPLAPHFAYGELDKADYTRAHLMHLANHWQDVAA